MTPKEFDCELTRLSKLMARAATEGNDSKVKDIDRQVQALFRTFQAHRFLKVCEEAA